MLVRVALPTDIQAVMQLANGYEDRLMPYIYDARIMEKFITHFWVAQSGSSDKLSGAIHCAYPNNELSYYFLTRIKLVPDKLAKSFSTSSNEIFLGHIVCPGKGSFGNIVRALKLVGARLHCYLSVKSPAFSSYTRHGFRFEEPEEIWNSYKGSTSLFSHGVWEGGTDHGHYTEFKN